MILQCAVVVMSGAQHRTHSISLLFSTWLFIAHKELPDTKICVVDYLYVCEYFTCEYVLQVRSSRLQTHHFPGEYVLRKRNRVILSLAKIGKMWDVRSCITKPSTALPKTMCT